jgi:hypothetical protein
MWCFSCFVAISTSTRVNERANPMIAPAAAAAAAPRQQRAAAGTRRKTHFCVTCRAPIAAYGRLLPCMHTYCLCCATDMARCFMCVSVLRA